MKSENPKIQNRQCKVFRFSQKEILMMAESCDDQMNDSRISMNWRVSNSRISTNSHKKKKKSISQFYRIPWLFPDFLVNFQIPWFFLVLPVFQVAWQRCMYIYIHWHIQHNKKKTMYSFYSCTQHNKIDNIIKSCHTIEISLCEKAILIITTINSEFKF